MVTHAGWKSSVILNGDVGLLSVSLVHAWPQRCTNLQKLHLNSGDGINSVLDPNNDQLVPVENMFDLSQFE